jgi:hypothetical protein
MVLSFAQLVAYYSTATNNHPGTLWGEGIMVKQKEVVEQRQDKRFGVQDGAMVIFKPSDAGMGRLIDISMGGLTFDYVTSQAPPTVEAAKLDIILTDSVFSLYDIPCQSIWELTIYEKSPTSKYRKRCGVKFGELTSEQRRLLEYFIEKHTTAGEKQA